MPNVLPPETEHRSVWRKIQQWHILYGNGYGLVLYMTTDTINC